MSSKAVQGLPEVVVFIIAAGFYWFKTDHISISKAQVKLSLKKFRTQESQNSLQISQRKK